MRAEWVVKKKKKCTPSKSQAQQCERVPSGWGIPPNSGQETRKLGRILPHSCAQGIAMFLQDILSFTNHIFSVVFLFSTTQLQLFHTLVTLLSTVFYSSRLLYYIQQLPVKACKIIIIFISSAHVQRYLCMVHLIFLIQILRAGIFGFYCKSL